MSATRVPDATDPRDDGLAPPSISIFQGDARATGLDRNSVNAIVGSPPYWRKRDYGHDDQIGMESTPDGYVDSIADCLTDWKRVLHPTGSVFLNIGDSYLKRSLVGIPGKIETAAHKMGWTVRNRVIWTKTGGMPDPCRSRLVGRHEYVIHLVRGRNYYYDLTGYQDHLGVTSNPGDVWQIEQERSMSAHLAPFPSELVRRALSLGCPAQVCATCGAPRRRVEERTHELDSSRPQARRAMALARQHGLTPEHLRAIRSTGVSDVGKARMFQSGAGRNSPDVQRLAAEAKSALGGYFREFTAGKRITVGWTDCGHGTPRRGMVLDPFVGTGTTATVASAMGRDAIGIDLTPMTPFQTSAAS